MLPSRYWEQLNGKNLAQLAGDGYDDFKRTLATNYFTWVVGPFDAQLAFLRAHLPHAALARAALQTLLAGRHHPMGWLPSKSYNVPHLPGLGVRGRPGGADGVLARLEEPLEGNPPRLHDHGRLISQDLANSVLEYRSILAPQIDRGQIRTILELGPGYGRTAFVFLSALPGARYVLVDIPPALAVSERYLSSVFADRRIFRYRPFRSYAEVRDEFERAQIAFLLPQQLQLLPDRSVDLFVNISSLHEMRVDQIRYYFEILGRLLRGYCYLKQWRESKIPYENVTIREADYPIPRSWRQLYWRPCAIQQRFFEALFELPAGP